MYTSKYSGYLSFINYSVNKSSFCCFGLDFDPSEKYIEKIWANLGLFTGCFLLTIVCLIASCRIMFWKALAYKGEEPAPISVLNRVLSNTLEQTFIFACLLYAVIYHNPMKWPVTYFAHLVRLFIVARVFYGIGFVLGHLTNIPPLRNLGFPGTLMAQFIIVLAFIGIDMFPKIGQLPLPLEL